MNSKGQGALEYLLLIGGAVLVAAIVIALLVGLPTTPGTNPQDKTDCAARAQFISCYGTVPTSNNGNCCAYKTDGTELSTATDFGYCAWKSAACIAP